MARTKSTYKCTGCETTIKTSFNAHLHPLLKVLICRSCHQSYGCGDFSLFNDPEVGPGVDECGDDNYCRWCVDGGNLFACGSAEKDDPMRCHYAFCSECIARNCPDDPVLNVDELDPEDKAKFKWLCYACDSNKLKKLRKDARDAIMALNQKDIKRTLNKTTSEPNKQKPDNSSKVSTGDRSTAAAPTPSKSSKSPLRTRAPPSSEVATPPPAKVRSPPPTTPPPPTIPTTPSSSSNSANKSASKSASKSAGDAVKIDNSKTTNPIEKPQTTERLQLKVIDPPCSNSSKKTIGTTNESSKKQSPSIENGSSSRSAEKIPLVEKLHLKPRSPVPKTLPSSNGNHPIGPQQFAKGSLHKPRPLSKQLKLSDDSSQIRPSTKVPLNDIELKKKLETYEKIKQSCVAEISDKFQTIIEMFQSKDLENKAILKFQIEDIEKPIQEFNVMLRDLMSLYHTQA